MNTNLHIAHNATAQSKANAISNEPSNIRLLVNVDNTELHLLNGVSGQLHVVHSASFAEGIIASQKKIVDAVRMYEDRIYKRVPLDIA